LYLLFDNIASRPCFNRMNIVGSIILKDSTISIDDGHTGIAVDW
jgi:hypothetical protein